jgi:DNA polymerase-1
MFSDKTGAPSTDKKALTYLADECDLVLDLLRWRELNTQLSKYLQSPLKSRAYLGKDVLHPCPKIFGTYTGRSTYSGKTARKFPTGLALHQIPRNKVFRKLIRPRPGYKHLELDAASQESRLMACQSQDPSMVKVFADDLDFHSFTGAKVGGMSYDDFLIGKAKDNKAITGPSGLRYCGKFLNLSQNFRVGVKTMRIQARVQYGLDKDWHTVKGWQDLWHQAYSGVKQYWKGAIQVGKTSGYAQTLGGRRFKLTYWGKDDRWGTESSAIMFPIQGSAADMADLAIMLMHKHFPEFLVFFTLHDAIHFEIPEDTTLDRVIEARTMLNNIDYEHYWGYKPLVPLLYDASVGPCWAELKEVK